MPLFHTIPPFYASLDLQGLNNHLWFERDSLQSKDPQRSRLAAERVAHLQRLLEEKEACLETELTVEAL